MATLACLISGVSYLVTPFVVLVALRSVRFYALLMIGMVVSLLSIIGLFGSQISLVGQLLIVNSGYVVVALILVILSIGKVRNL